MNSDVKLDVNVVAVDRSDLLPPSSVSSQPKVSGVTTKASNELAPPVFVVLVLVIVLLFGLGTKLISARMSPKSLR